MRRLSTPTTMPNVTANRNLTRTPVPPLRHWFVRGTILLALVPPTLFLGVTGTDAFVPSFSSSTAIRGRDCRDSVFCIRLRTHPLKALQVPYGDGEDGIHGSSSNGSGGGVNGSNGGVNGDNDQGYKFKGFGTPYIDTLERSTSQSMASSSSSSFGDKNVNGSNHTSGPESRTDPSEEAPTAPEVNKWTAIMADGTDAATKNNGQIKSMYFVNDNNAYSNDYNNNNNNINNSNNIHNLVDYTNEPFHQDDASSMEALYNDLKDMSEYDKSEVEKYWDCLMPTVSYLGTQNVAKIKQALRVAYRAHRGQMRKSGEPFIIHPVEVALLLAGLKMDAETIMSGLLHDTVEDTDLTFPQVEAMFGHVVKSIVEGETKVSKLPKLAFSDYADEQAENLRQMFVAMTDDYRIIIVKLADRLHNMRTLKHMKPAKQQKISRETLDIFAPLAHRMGIWQFKSELEDTAFKYLYPRQYQDLKRRLVEYESRCSVTLEKSEKILRETLDSDQTLRDQAVRVNVCGRTKELYSLWYKMDTKEVDNLDHIADVKALRVVIEPKRPKRKTVNANGDQEVVVEEENKDYGVWLCYHVLGLVQHLPGFQPHPTKVKDYISFPKPNGYQSLHTALMLNGQTIEVQIRTSAMHQIAEYGMASHWAYVDGKKRSVVPSNNELYASGNDLYNTPWLSSIKEWQDDVVCSRDFVDCVRRELLGKRVFVFLRNGKILNLAKGATAIDAAFQIHTEVGLWMHGVEINGKPVPFSYELRNGDVVSVLTGGGKPATDWMRYAKSRSTRSKLRSYFRRKQRESLHDAGEILLMDFLSMHAALIKQHSFLEDVDFEVPTQVGEVAAFLPGKTRYEDMNELLIDIGKSHDRDFLRGIVANLFLVPRSRLADAEETRSSSFARDEVVAAVHQRRQMANDAGAAADTQEEGDEIEIDSIVNRNDNESVNGSSGAGAVQPLNGYKIDSDVDASTQESDLDMNGMEIADPEHLCEKCLPIIGDKIVGTRPSNISSDEAHKVTPTVHRCGCPIAQSAINGALKPKPVNNGSGQGTNGSSYNDKNGSKSKSSFRSRLKLRLGSRTSYGSTSSQSQSLDAVKLKWPEAYTLEGEDIKYLAEVVVVAFDRKLLLADCSEIVSEMSEIVKTGSLTTEEHATLEFLVKVHSLEQLQKVMDNLRAIRSVMSVERKFGSSLMS